MTGHYSSSLSSDRWALRREIGGKGRCRNCGGAQARAKLVLRRLSHQPSHSQEPLGDTAQHPRSAMTPPKPPARSPDAEASFAKPIGSEVLCPFCRQWIRATHYTTVQWRITAHEDLTSHICDGSSMVLTKTVPAICPKCGHGSYVLGGRVEHECPPNAEVSEAGPLTHD
jgi:hypothetical protein